MNTKMIQGIGKRYSQLTAPAPAPEKAISHRPDLAGIVHLTSQRADEVPPDMALGEYQGRVDVYKAHTWTHKAVKKTAEQIAPLRVRVTDAEGDEIAHPLAELFETVNDTHDSTYLWTAWLVSMMLAGEAPLELVDNGNSFPVEIWNREPAGQFHVLPDQSRPLFPTVAGYRIGDNETVLPPETVIFDKFYNPAQPFRGLAPIQAVRESIIIDVFAQIWNKNFFKRGARPDYALVAQEGGLTQTEREEYEISLDTKYAGSDNWHKPIVLEKGITDLKTLSFPPKDLEWIKAREMSREEVGALFGVPDEIMGWGRDTYENFGEAWRVWWKLSLKPLVDHRDGVLTHHFAKIRPLLKPGQFIRTDLGGIGALQDDQTPAIKNAVAMVKEGYPANSVNDWLNLDFPPIPGGDLPFYGLRPLSPGFGGALSAQSGQVPPETPPEAEKAAPVRVVTVSRQANEREKAAYSTWQANALARLKERKSPGRPFFSDDIPANHSYELATVLGLCRSAPEVGAVFAHLDDYLNIKAVLGAREDVPPERLAQEDAFVPPLQRWLNEQAGRVFGVVRLTTAPPDARFWTAEKTAMAGFLSPFVEDWAEAGVAHAVGLLSEVALGVDANVNARAAEWAGKHALDLAKALTGTTKELAKAKIRNFLASGKPLDKLLDELEQVIAPRWRAELIASTETTRAWGQAALDVGTELDVIKGHIWLTARDERVCPICAPLNGQFAPKGGVFPGGFSYPPAHPRCRCGLGYSV